MPAGEDREAVIAAAQELHEEGKLFRPVGASCGGIPEEQPSDGEDPPAAAAEEDGEEEEEEEEEKELALLSPPPDEVDELEVEMELMEESMELPKEVMGEPMEGDSKRAGDIKHGGTKGSTTTQGRQKDRAAPEARRPAIGIRAQATSRNVREIVT